MRISIVIPTRDRPDSLRRCLGAVAAQDVDVEVVVVDDGSRDPAHVRSVLALLPDATLLRSDGRGPASARNAGARATTGEVICFTDDDCEPEPGWARLLARSALSSSGVAAGRTVPPAGAGAAVLAAQAITDHLLIDSLDPATRRLGFAPSCNLACTRAAAERLPFDESYPFAAGEDRDWSARATACGLAPVYEPHAVVVHRPDPGLRSFIRQQVRYGRGAARFRRGEPDRDLAGPPFYAALVRAGFARGRAPGMLVAAAQLATAAGVGLERLATLGRNGSGRAQQRLAGEPEMVDPRGGTDGRGGVGEPGRS